MFFDSCSRWIELVCTNLYGFRSQIAEFHEDLGPWRPFEVAGSWLGSRMCSEGRRGKVHRLRATGLSGDGRGRATGPVERQKALPAPYLTRVGTYPPPTAYSPLWLHLSRIAAYARRSRRPVVASQRLRHVRVAPGRQANDAVREACGQAAGHDASVVMQGPLHSWHALLTGPQDIDRTRFRATRKALRACRALSSKCVQQHRTSDHRSSNGMSVQTRSS